MRQRKSYHNEFKPMNACDRLFVVWMIRRECFGAARAGAFILPQAQEADYNCSYMQLRYMANVILKLGEGYTLRI